MFMPNLLARRYASALLEIGKEQELLDTFHEQLVGVVDQFKQHKKFEQLIISPQITTEEKKKVISEVFGKVLNPYLLNFIYLLIDKDREGYIEDIANTFNEMFYNEKNILSAEVISAVALREEQLSTIKNKLAAQFNKEIIINNQVDPSIIGGVIVYAGDQIIDGSVKSKLNQLKANLKEVRLQEIGVN